MLNPEQFRTEVVRPTLEALDLHSRAAENLLVGTALQESDLTHLRQIGGGPALGLYQMEPQTHDDIWDNYLAHRDARAERVTALLAPGPDRVAQLVTNLAYATALCRIHYLRVPAALPAADDIDALAAYWKQHYNTPLGAGRADEFAGRYRRHHAG